MQLSLGDNRVTLDFSERAGEKAVELVVREMNTEGEFVGMRALVSPIQTCDLRKLALAIYAYAEAVETAAEWEQTQWQL